MGFSRKPRRGGLTMPWFHSLRWTTFSLSQSPCPSTLLRSKIILGVSDESTAKCKQSSPALTPQLTPPPHHPRPGPPQTQTQTGGPGADGLALCLAICSAAHTLHPQEAPLLPELHVEGTQGRFPQQASPCRDCVLNADCGCNGLRLSMLPQKNAAFLHVDA